MHAATALTAAAASKYRAMAIKNPFIEINQLYILSVIAASVAAVYSIQMFTVSFSVQFELNRNIVILGFVDWFTGVAVADWL